ncbi:hypothetical protein [Mycobacteroides abscessus]|uniref:hypothetical protein n=1 Tax=Mycobacteroides abscessus TaxID=36809 RepID=UPI0016040796|nr:hypothetical protein [Mycobacteroides abscessus]
MMGDENEMAEVHGKTPMGKTAVIASALAAASCVGFSVVAESATDEPTSKPEQ